MILAAFIFLFAHQDEKKAAAMVGLSEEGPPKVDTEEVNYMVLQADGNCYNFSRVRGSL